MRYVEESYDLKCFQNTFSLVSCSTLVSLPRYARFTSILSLSSNPKGSLLQESDIIFDIDYNNDGMHSIRLIVASFTDKLFLQTYHFHYFQYFQTREEKQPKEERIDHYRPQGEEFDKAYTYDYKSDSDDAKTLQKRVLSEKITVTDGDMPGVEETEEPRYPKALDIGRIVIDEMAEGKEPLVKPDVPRRDKVEETCVDIETYDKVESRQGPDVKEDVAKVGRLKITDYENTRKESDRLTLHQMVIFFSWNFCDMFLILGFKNNL